MGRGSVPRWTWTDALCTEDVDLTSHFLRFIYRLDTSDFWPVLYLEGRSELPGRKTHRVLSCYLYVDNLLTWSHKSSFAPQIIF